MQDRQRKTPSPLGARIDIIDACRGLSILLMVVWHLFYDLVLFRMFPENILFSPLVNALQLFFVCLFIIMSGASTQFTRSNYKRALKMLICAAVVTLVTWFLNNDAFIKFGILHFLGFAALIYAVLEYPLRWLTSKIPCFVWIILFFASRYALNRTVTTKWLWPLGLVYPGFVSTDYYPIFPWFFMYMFGIWFGQIVVERKLPDWFYETRIPFFSAVGRKTLWIYMLHQPVIYGIVYLVSEYILA